VTKAGAIQPRQRFSNYFYADSQGREQAAHLRPDEAENRQEKLLLRFIPVYMMFQRFYAPPPSSHPVPYV
jgi:hypothetical protein